MALARALVLKPSVLLLDEPLGALDAKLRRALQIELKAIQETVGITFVYVTHDQEEALTMSTASRSCPTGSCSRSARRARSTRSRRRRLRRRLPRRLEPDGGEAEGGGASGSETPSSAPSAGDVEAIGDV